MMKAHLIALGAAATLATGAPVLAAEKNPDMVVSYQDLDLSTARGQKTLERRIDAAAKKYCRVDTQRSGTRIASPQAGKCYREVKRQATRQFAQITGNRNLGG